MIFAAGDRNLPGDDAVGLEDLIRLELKPIPRSSTHGLIFPSSAGLCG